MVGGSELNTLQSALAIGGLVALAYLAGLASRPLFDRGTGWLRVLVRRRRASQRDVLEALQRLLPELQKAAEASGDAEAYRHCLSLNLEAIGLRDRIASPRIREAVERYQHDALDVAELIRGEAERGPLVGDAGKVSGQQALGRLHSLLVAKQTAWESMSQVLARISGELRRQ